MQRDPVGHDCAEAQQRGEVEHIGAEDDASLDLVLAPD